MFNKATIRMVDMFKAYLMLIAGIFCVSVAADVVVGPADGPASSYPFCGS